jgi:hypothetical protein
MYKYAKSLKKDEHDFPFNTNVWSIIYREFSHDVDYIINKGCYIAIWHIFILFVLLHGPTLHFFLW